MGKLKSSLRERKFKGVRLPEQTLEAIEELLVKHFGKGVKAWIFGSRADLNAKGGDIDIYVEVEKTEKAFSKKLNFLVELDKKIGEQKVDLVVRTYNCKEPIALKAKGEGVRII